jgi:putative transcriptional regulator
MARKTLEEILASEPDVDHAKLDATTEEDIRRHMIEDGQDPDADIPADAEHVVPPQVVREKLGMTQEEFAKALRIPIGTLRNWEQRRVGLDPAVRSLLAIVYKMPEVLKALAPRRQRPAA